MLKKQCLQGLAIAGVLLAAGTAYGQGDPCDDFEVIPSAWVWQCQTIKYCHLDPPYVRCTSIFKRANAQCRLVETGGDCKGCSNSWHEYTLTFYVKEFVEAELQPTCEGFTCPCPAVYVEFYTLEQTYMESVCVACP